VSSYSVIQQSDNADLQFLHHKENMCLKLYVDST
jgi:hypothetical protein